MITVGDYSFLVATRPEQIFEAQRLRRRVAEETRGAPVAGLGARSNPEADPHDEYALTAAALRPDGRVVGTARLILDSPLGLPAARAAVFSPPGQTGRVKLAELSDLAIDPAHRGGVRDVFDGDAVGGDGPALGDGVAVARWWARCG